MLVAALFMRLVEIEAQVPADLERKLLRFKRNFVVNVLCWVLFGLAWVHLLQRLSITGDEGLSLWISSDTLYPVHVFVDVVGDRNPISAWKFSVAPCWFPDLAATGLFWLVTQNPILATLLPGMIQLPLLALAFRAGRRAIGAGDGTVQDAFVLGMSTLIALYVAGHTSDHYPRLWSFFLPQTGGTRPGGGAAMLAMLGFTRAAYSPTLVQIRVLG